MFNMSYAELLCQHPPPQTLASIPSKLKKIVLLAGTQNSEVISNSFLYLMLLLLSHFSKDKRGCWEECFRTYKRKKTIHTEIEKLNCQQTDACWAMERQGDPERNFNRLCQVPPCLPYLIHTIVDYSLPGTLFQAVRKKVKGSF